MIKIITEIQLRKKLLQIWEGVANSLKEYARSDRADNVRYSTEETIDLIYRERQNIVTELRRIRANIPPTYGQEARDMLVSLIEELEK